jgi:protein-disulfide isomerase
MMFRRIWFCIGLGLVLSTAGLNAQDKSGASAQSNSSAKNNATSKSLNAGAVTINMPEGMTKDQADEILKELKAIHQLLANQQTAAARPSQPAAPVNDKVQMSVAPGWYSLGRDDAPVTMVEFADYQCPFCRKYHSETFAELKKNYIDTGKVRYVSRDLPLEFHPNAPSAAVAARCAGEQKKFWEMRELMVANSADLTNDSLLKYGETINLNMAEFRGCLNDKKYAEAVKKDMADAGTLGISGTPSFVIGKTDKSQISGVRIVGALPYSVFETAIKNQLSLTSTQ